MKNKQEIRITASESTGGIKRENFGPGEFGEHCYLLIRHGIPCDAIVGPDGERCGKPATGTTDYDYNGDPTILGHCSEEHHLMIVSGVRKDLQLIERETVFGRNGFGRNAVQLFSG